MPVICYIPRNGSELFKVFFGHLILQHFILSFLVTYCLLPLLSATSDSYNIKSSLVFVFKHMPQRKSYLHLMSSELDQILKSLVSEFFQGNTRHVKKITILSRWVLSLSPFCTIHWLPDYSLVFKATTELIGVKHVLKCHKAQYS